MNRRGEEQNCWPSLFVSDYTCSFHVSGLILTKKCNTPPAVVVEVENPLHALQTHKTKSWFSCVSQWGCFYWNTMCKIPVLIIGMNFLVWTMLSSKSIHTFPTISLNCLDLKSPYPLENSNPFCGGVKIFSGTPHLWKGDLLFAKLVKLDICPFSPAVILSELIMMQDQ